MTEPQHGGCCAPGRGGTAVATGIDAPAGQAGPAPVPRRSSGPELVELDGGWFEMGSAEYYGYEADGEGPVRSVRVDQFRIAARAVSNREFAAFVDATGYVTSAEQYGASFVFGGLLSDDVPPTRGVVGAPWWREVAGATLATSRGRERLRPLQRDGERLGVDGGPVQHQLAPGWTARESDRTTFR